MLQYLCNLSCNIYLLYTTLHEVGLSSTFCSDCSNFQSPLHSVTPLQQLVTQYCFARSANQDPYYSLLGPPGSQVCELLAIPLHSVTPFSCNCNATLLHVARQVAQKIAQCKSSFALYCSNVYPLNLLGESYRHLLKQAVEWHISCHVNCIYISFIYSQVSILPCTAVI